MACKKKTPKPLTKSSDEETLVIESKETLKPKRKNKPGAGRPADTGAKPTQEQINQIRNYSKIRLSTEEISYLIGTSKMTLHRWLKRYPEIVDTIKKARNESKAHAVNNAYLRAFPLPEQVYDESGNPVYDKNGNPVRKMPKGDTVLAIFLLKTMFGFKEPDKKIQVTSKKGNSEIVLNIGGSNMTQEEVIQSHLKYYDNKQ